MKKSLVWVALHTSLMVSIVTCWFTGMRIAAVSRDGIFWLSELLPQGQVHVVHLISAMTLIIVIVVYLFLRFLHILPNSDKIKSSFFHRSVIYFGYILLPIIVLSGLNRYFGWIEQLERLSAHYWLALLLLVYILLHAASYFIQYGISAIKVIFLFENKSLRRSCIALMLGAVGSVLLFLWINQAAYKVLPVYPIALSQLMEVDGKDDEAAWKEAKSVTVQTFGGEGFHQGQTAISIKAIENSVEAFFYIKWKDDTQSFKHLPLKKTEQGWQVQGDGFYRFDEKVFYEDKFAVMLSSVCNVHAAGTTHLGPKPLKSKPANWHGKGYHYTEEERVVDIWHWKAVRTNDMLIADDNFFGPPVLPNAGQRRYKAGYLADGKESGAYVMNWLWYKPDYVVPKRLPKDAAMLPSKDPVISWFSYEPYQKQKDIYPVGTIMPSIMYRSNTFEGDRADVRAYGIWKAGYWHLEMSRKLSTGSKHDVAIEQGVCLWLAAFDHAQIGHTRHLKPFKLKLIR